MPECLFLAGFDQLLLAHEKKESLFLKPEHMRQIFNLAGIVMPPVLLNGEVAGRWKLKSNKLSIELFRSVSAQEKRAICQKADALWNALNKIEIA